MPTPSSCTHTVFISAGEASGDAHAARMVDEMKQMEPTLYFTGMGGEKLRSSGVEILVDINKMAVVGLVEVLIKYRSLKAELKRLQNYIEKNRPDLVILVDYQEFNQQLSAFAKQLGIQTLFYIGPQVWAWRPKRVYKMPSITDHLAVILPFEKDCYKDTDLDVHFTGHPLTDTVKKDKKPEQARRLLSLPESTTIGLFPGSRPGEIKRVLPVLLDTAKRIRESKPDCQFVLPMASSLKNTDFQPFQQPIEALSVHIIEDHFYDTAMACDVVLTSSGTSALEIALLEIPMVIVYKIAPLSFFILNKLVTVKFLGLMNIISGREIVQEFIQGDAKPHAITEEALRLLNDITYRENMIKALAEIRRQLGAGGGSKNVAKLACTLLKNVRKPDIQP